MNLTTKTFDELLALRDEVNNALDNLIGAERQAIEAKLEKLGSYGTINAIRMVPRKIAPKYRDPDTGLTWAGRGLTPKWMRGKNKKQFLIAQP